MFDLVLSSELKRVSSVRTCADPVTALLLDFIVRVNHEKCKLSVRGLRRMSLSTGALQASDSRGHCTEAHTC